jgi:hypothetical protein
MSEISSGLVAVAWQVRNGWSSCDLYRTLKSATEDRDMLQKRADLAGNLMAYRVEPLVRLSDAEAIIAQKDAEILEQCRINGMGAEREAALLGQIERQSERIKELESDVDEEAHIQDRMAKLLAETAVALKGPEKALHRHGWQDLPDVAAKQSAALKLAREALMSVKETSSSTRLRRIVNDPLAAINEVIGE